jgi:hypothetical protein
MDAVVATLPPLSGRWRWDDDVADVPSGCTGRNRRRRYNPMLCLEHLYIRHLHTIL